MLSFKVKAKLFFTASAVTAAVALSQAQQVWAKAAPDELAKLGLRGTELTPAGATRAGNAEGTIPEWKFEPLPVPAGFKPGSFHPDPYATDKIQFTITAQNYKQYADKLSEGQKKMFETYPDYRMNIYQTRRSAVFPEYVYKAAMDNAGRAEEVANDKGEIGFKNAVIAWAFPVPHTAGQVLMNAISRPQQPYQYYWDNTAAVSTTGDFQVSKIIVKAYRPWSLPESSVETFDPSAVESGIHGTQTVVSPAKSAGQVYLAIDPMVYTKTFRRAWLYNPGQRRIKRAPQVTDDYPVTGSDGLLTTDQRFGWLNSNQRFDWTLEGKQEMYIPYNAYKLHSGDTKVEDVVTAEGRLNPDLSRYELHRVWKLVGTLRKGISHVYSKRVFYLDEDSWAPVIHDNYDLRGQLWRLFEQHLVTWYDVGFMNDTIIAQYDITAGRMVLLGLDNDGPGPNFAWRPEPNEYTPAAIRRTGVR